MILYLIIGCIILILAFYGLLMLKENQFIYFPVRHPEGDWQTGEHQFYGLNCSIEDHYFQAADGTELHAWLYESAEANDTILYCHGNAGNIATRKEKMAFILQSGMRIFTLDYRGYGRSQGSPSEAGLIADVDAAYHYLLEQGINPENMIIYGASLGGGSAIQLAAKYKVKAIILESIFTSIPDMARKRMPFVPKFIVRTKFDNFNNIKNLKCPVFMIHGDKDEVIPVEMGRKLIQEAK